MPKAQHRLPFQAVTLKPAISVIVATYNRPVSTVECLESIRLNSFTDYEIILIDQSNNDATFLAVQKIADKRIRYYRGEAKGLSWSRNYGVSKAKASLLVFTDSDCLADKNWLAEVFQIYHTQPEIAGCFGNTQPYQPHKHPHETCPCTFTSQKITVHNHPNTLHWQTLGSGNNMSFRKSLFTQVGPFKEWLGVGSIGSGGEDTEFIFRVLAQGKILVTNPTAVIYHHRWLNSRQVADLRGQYAAGLFAFFTYYIWGQGSWPALQLYGTFLWSHFRFVVNQLTFVTTMIIKGFVLCYLILKGILKGIGVGIKVSLEEKFHNGRYPLRGLTTRFVK